MRWFGESWGAPVCSEETREVTPVGAVCAMCELEIEPADQGFIVPSATMASGYTEEPFHLDCFLQTVTGGTSS